MSKSERSPDSNPKRTSSPSDSGGERRNDRPHRPISPDVEPVFDDKLAALVASFEERIAKFKAQVVSLENRITELQSAKDRAKSAFDEFLNVQELSDMIRHTHNPPKVVKILTDLLSKFIDYENLGVYLFSDTKNNLDPIGSQYARLQQAAQSQYDEGIIDWVISERRPVIVPWTESFGTTTKEKTKNLIVIPMIVGEDAIGVTIMSTARSADHFSGQDLKMVYFAVSQAAVSVQNARGTNEIRTTKEFLSDLLENAGDIIFSIDPNGIFSFINPRVEELGFNKDDLLNQHFRLFFKDQETIRRINSTLSHGSKQIFDYEFSRGAYRTQAYTVNLVPLRGERGRHFSALGIMRNVTEIYNLQKKLLESERLAAYTQTVITLNHEINNPLTTVMGNVYLLEKDTEGIKDDKLKQRLSVIQENCQRIQQVIKKLERINELKTVSYLGSTKMVDLGDLDDDS